jgi:hypothetical protein
MATVLSSNHLARPSRLRNTAAGQSLGTPGSSSFVLQTLAFEGRKLLGAILLLLSVLMMSTLLLLPVGLPLSLLAVALIAAPSNS